MAGLILIFSIILIIICLLFLGTIIMYIVFAVKNSKEKRGRSAGTIVVSVLSILFTLVIIIIGVFAVIKKSRTLCLYFAIIMLIMFIFELVQVILFALDVNFLVPQRTDLKRQYGQDPVTYFYVVCGVTMFVCAVGFVDALLLRWQINKKKTGGSNYYE